MLQPTGPQLIELCTNGFELHGFINLLFMSFRLLSPNKIQSLKACETA